MHVTAETDGIQWIYGRVLSFKFDVEKKLLVLDTMDGKRHKVEAVIKLEVMDKSPNRPMAG